MAFVIGRFGHESNCFAAHPTTEEDFRQRELRWGGDLVRDHRGKRTVLGGFIEGLKGCEIVGSVSAAAVPSGPVAAEFYRRIKQDLLDTVQEAGELDGVLLSLHGAMSVEEEAEILDPEGDIVSAVRKVAGAGVPIAAVFDLHSDTTDLLLRSADITLAYNEEPHRDRYERGLEAADLIQRIVREEIRPTAARERVPMLLPAINMATDRGPMYELHRLRAELEKTPQVIDISIHAGFYGANQPEVGFSVVCTTDDAPGLAREMARRVAEAAWQKREAFLVDLMPIDVAVQLAIAKPGPVGLIDEADDPAGGASADSVALLRGMLEGGVEAGAFSFVKDAEVARHIAQVGEGGRVRARLGGKTDDLHGEPVDIDARVLQVVREPIPLDSWSGESVDGGTVGVIDADGVIVIVAEHKIVTESIDIFELLGYDVSQMDAVAVKGLGLHIRQALEGKVEITIPVDGVGITHPDVRKLGPYTRVRRPIWPLDELPAGAYPDW